MTRKTADNCKMFYSPKMLKQIPNFWQNDAKFPNSRGMGHISKMVGKSPEVTQITCNNTKLLKSLLHSVTIEPLEKINVLD
jgi:hypothetical protein